jgi:hypothetical protein
MDYQSWYTLFELKEDHPKLGLKGWIFFIVDFAWDLTDDLKYIISNPTFTGLGVSKGISSYIVSQNELEELFNPIDKTFKEYAKELEDDYFNN